MAWRQWRMSSTPKGGRVAAGALQASWQSQQAGSRKHCEQQQQQQQQPTCQAPRYSSTSVAQARYQSCPMADSSALNSACRQVRCVPWGSDRSPAAYTWWGLQYSSSTAAEQHAYGREGGAGQSGSDRAPAAYSWWGLRGRPEATAGLRAAKHGRPTGSGSGTHRQKEQTHTHSLPHRMLSSSSTSRSVSTWERGSFTTLPAGSASSSAALRQLGGERGGPAVQGQIRRHLACRQSGRAGQQSPQVPHLSGRRACRGSGGWPRQRRRCAQLQAQEGTAWQGRMPGL